MLISPSWKLGNRVKHQDDGFWHVKQEYKDSWSNEDQELLDNCNNMLEEYRNDRAKFVFDDDID
ncbi:Uncharacterised protein [Chlamydia trachomatis]|nr:Uncharacterised protein [Chlamydia trachomatis]